ncbi:MAG: prolyl oligopeptidase family serine peptidase [Bryobacteraceae bacterium]|nr:prolyl oligopeptidase family serine peptidase [Bryobacteraceae bacterium]
MNRLIPGLLLMACCAIAQPKRALTHADFDGFRSISGQKISPDGKHVAYGWFPQEGDGEVVVREVASGVEVRTPAGERPQPLPPDPEAEGGPPPQRTSVIQFTDDSQWVIFTTFPSRAEVAAARQAKKKPEEMPKPGLVLIDLRSKAIQRVDGVKSFQLARDASDFVVYHREAGLAAAVTPAAAGEKDEDQGRRGAGGRPSNAASTGSPLVLRRLSDGVERTFADASDYSYTHDGKTLVYAVTAKNAENGIFALAVTATGDPAPLVTGKGKFTRLTWDEKQRNLAAMGEESALVKLYHWDRQAATATALDIGSLPAGQVVSSKGSLSFSRDGDRLFFGAAAPAKPAPKPDDSGVEKAGFDLWHYRDDHIQPMQKVRAAAERNRTYRAAYLLASRKTVPLADPAMAEISLSEEGRFGIGSDDRAYRRAVEYDRRYADWMIVNTQTGERIPVAQKQTGSLNWSHRGNAAVFFDGKHWFALDVTTGARVNLTASIPTKFFNEEDDHPDLPPAYGLAGWVRDGMSVLLYDRYDIWQVDLDGRRSINVTDGLGRAEGLQFRAIRLATDPAERGFDPAAPLLLRAERIATRETGFYRDFIGRNVRPEKLVMNPRAYGVPVKAEKAERVLFTSSRFDEFPDLYVADSNLANVQRVSDGGKQYAPFSWGKSELISFRSLDGTPLKGTLFKPENFDPAKKYPLIVYIYERLSQGVHNFVAPAPGQNINPSFYTSNGYLVLQPDIAYRVGYPGPSALQCVLPAIDAVVAKGGVDENNIGIQGHSWGGYQIAYMLGQTKRFKAAAAGAPVANMFSAYNGIRWGPGIPRQFQYERTQSRIGGTPWQYPLRFLENSPIFQADKVTTPLLMLHNDADDAVPWYQGIEYYLALRRLEKEVYLFSYNGEPHGIRRRVNQKDYARRLQEFFDFNLKGAAKPDWMERGIPFLEKEPVARTTVSDQP